MILTHAHIKNFRSIDDSGKFAVEKDISCGVGKNEAGKTALLTALYRINPIFNDGNFDVEKDYPRRHYADYAERHKGRHAEVIRTWWRITESEKEDIVDLFGAEVLTSDEVQVYKGYDNKTCWSVTCNEAAMLKHLIDGSDLHDEEKTTLGGAKNLAELKTKLAAYTEQAERHSKFAQQLAKQFTGTVEQAIIAQLDLPKFLLFSHYQRMQGQVSVDQIRQKKAENRLNDDDQVFIALCDMAGVTVDDAASLKNFETLIARFEGASNKISNEIFEYWSQNKYLKVHFRLDQALEGDPVPFNSGRIMRTRIENTLHQVTVPFDDRSTGFVWFFSFLALFSQVKKRHTDGIIILLDEPGLSLHGKAQGDLQRYFRERLAPNHQVIYTTHSPFMVPTHNLLAVRTVEDVLDFDKEGRPVVHGTKVGDDVLSTDRDTVFPLQAALGYEITQSLFVGEHTMLVEGPSDLLYLKAVSQLLQSLDREFLDTRWTICPTGSIDKVSAFLSLFGANKLHVAVLTDFATGQKQKVDALRKSKLLREGHVFTLNEYAKQPEADIEDIIGGGAYVALVNMCYGLTGQHAVPAAPAGMRVVKHVEDHFKTQPDTVPEFDHYTPAAYFAQNTAAVMKALVAADIEGMLSRFETISEDFNKLLNEEASGVQNPAKGTQPSMKRAVGS